MKSVLTFLLMLFAAHLFAGPKLDTCLIEHNNQKFDAVFGRTTANEAAKHFEFAIQTRDEKVGKNCRGKLFRRYQYFISKDSTFALEFSTKKPLVKNELNDFDAYLVAVFVSGDAKVKIDGLGLSMDSTKINKTLGKDSTAYNFGPVVHNRRFRTHSEGEWIMDEYYAKELYVYYKEDSATPYYMERREISSKKRLRVAEDSYTSLSKIEKDKFCYWKWQKRQFLNSDFVWRKGKVEEIASNDSLLKFNYVVKIPQMVKSGGPTGKPTFEDKKVSAEISMYADPDSSTYKLMLNEIKSHTKGDSLGYNKGRVVLEADKSAFRSDDGSVVLYVKQDRKNVKMWWDGHYIRMKLIKGRNISAIMKQIATLKNGYYYFLPSTTSQLSAADILRL